MKNYNILIIDDEFNIRDNFREYLEDFDLTVKTAENGKIGLDIFQNEKFDAVLVDLRMPIMSGEEFIQKAKEIKPNVPIIVISGNTDITNAVSILSKGACDYITKPVSDMNLVLEKINTSIKKSNQIKLNDEIAKKNEDLLSEKEIILQNLNNKLTNISKEYINVEKELEESEKKFQTLLNNLPGIVYQRENSENQKFLFLSYEFKSLTGYSEIDFINNDENTIFSLIHPDDRNYYAKTLESFINQYKNFEIKYRILKKNGEIRWFSEKGSFVKYKNAKITIEGFIQDITEKHIIQEKLEELNKNLESKIKKRTIELEKKINDLKSFTYTLSHDVKSPLTIVKSNIDFLLMDYEDFLDEKALNYIISANQNLDRISELISTILKVANLSEYQLNLKKINISNIIYDLFQNYAKLYPNKTYEFNVKKDVYLECDPSIFIIALENLIKNSIKFSSFENTPTLEFGTINENNSEIYYIKDNGIGFDSDKETNIFKTFKRSDNSGKFNGQGIGLATVKKIIDKHDFSIWFKSKKTFGATVFFKKNQ